MVVMSIVKGTVSWYRSWSERDFHDNHFSKVSDSECGGLCTPWLCMRDCWLRVCVCVKSFWVKSNWMPECSIMQLFFFFFELTLELHSFRVYVLLSVSVHNKSYTCHIAMRWLCKWCSCNEIISDQWTHQWWHFLFKHEHFTQSF